MRIPRLLPLVAVAIGGVLAINALGGARDLPGLVSGARAWAEEVAKPAKAAKPAAKTTVKADAKAEASADAAKPETLTLAAAGPLPAPAVAAVPGRGGAPYCAPSDASIAREAGLSPAQLQLLQSLQARRGQLDEREKALEMQLELVAAAGAKLDARVASLTALKAEIQGLLMQADERQKAELARMVKVYATMAKQKPKEAAKQLTIMDDSVRLPILASPEMSTGNLAVIMQNMAPADAKKLSEALAKRMDAKKIDAGRAALAAPSAAATPPAAPPTAPAEAAPTKLAAAKPAPKRAPRPAASKPAAAAPTTPPSEAAPAAPAPAPAAPAAAEKAATG